ncbi:mannitol dehydrogenase family protein [Aeromicrobium wangtongii]|uniref:Mannitol-1-phosphate 5-dehydrogenase n=1 Tax=Aeromicrobium wangtongii TaxID=2969247 RepID=A0ABY5M8M5_9ACTN|nr:mannitol dehydrogenase family protein [Aeromicrobium wangtongii]MCD9199845.1 mannitol dehydrogenase family protein [Aeromicrobium wangtongii]UUP13464.1 mannitol dehydrogenase family protein [Aeromicrobium wangtongii]
MKLSDGSLEQLPPEVGSPEYDRSAVTAGIVHVGVGGFHRSHQAVYVDRLLAAGATDWGICGVGLLPQDRAMQEALDGQDHLYTVVERHPDGSAQARVIGSIVEYLFAPDDVDAVIEKMASETTRIVSLTITEGGYNLIGGDGDFDADAPAIRADLEPGATPATVFGIVVEALDRRRRRGLDPFTVVSCDNIEANGAVARRAFQGFAALRDEELAGWIEQHVAFPHSMVDRITPVTTDADRAFVAEQFGIEDACPVTCESFLQWVISDEFSAGRPPLEDAGVSVVDDVRPYELMKLRLLNASHQVMGYLGSLAGLTHVHDAAHDDDFARLIRGYMEHEAQPTLEPVPDVDFADYRATLMERFGNGSIADTLARQCVDGSERLPKFLLPVVRAQLAAGGDIDRAVLALAGWARYAEGTDDEGRPLELNDVRHDEIAAAASRQGDDPTAMLELSMFEELRDDSRFVAAYVEALQGLRDHGARAAVAALTSGPGER